VRRNWRRTKSPSSMIYPLISRPREQNDHVKTHQRWFTGDNHVRDLPGTRRAFRNPWRAQLCLQRSSYHRPSPHADELCRRRAQDRATVRGGHVLLLDPGDSASAPCGAGAPPVPRTTGALWKLCQDKPAACSAALSPRPVQAWVSGAGWRHETTDKSVWRAAKDRPAVRVLASQHGMILHHEPTPCVGIVGKNPNLPMAVPHPCLGRCAIVHCAARFAVRRFQRAVPNRQWIGALMRCGDPDGEGDADADKTPHVSRPRAITGRARRLPCAGSGIWGPAA
jgi:hypothetical protein